MKDCRWSDVVFIVASRYNVQCDMVIFGVYVTGSFTVPLTLIITYKLSCKYFKVMFLEPFFSLS